jgi:hypothetical protein
MKADETKLFNYADRWITANFGENGRLITEWELGDYVSAVLNFYQANRKEKQDLIEELKRKG